MQSTPKTTTKSVYSLSAMSKLSLRKLALAIIPVISFISCNDEKDDTKIEFFGRWKIKEIVTTNLASGAVVISDSYETCLTDDMLEFTSDTRLVVYDVGIRCSFPTRSYDHVIDISRSSEGKVVGFQVLPIVDEVYHPVIEPGSFFFVESADIDNMEISDLRRCSSANSNFCTRKIRLQRA